MVITFKVLTPSRLDSFSRHCLGAYFFLCLLPFFCRKSDDFEPKLGPRSKGPPCHFSSLFSSWSQKGSKGRPGGAQGHQKAPMGEPRGTHKEPRKRPGYPKRVLGDLFRARWREGRRQLYRFLRNSDQNPKKIDSWPLRLDPQEILINILIKLPSGL